MLNRILASALVLVVCGFCGLGCGDDESSDDGSAGTSGKGSKDAGSKDSGTMDSGSEPDDSNNNDKDSGSTGNPNQNTPDAAPPLMCGDTRCTVSGAAAVAGGVACCTDDDRCGLVVDSDAGSECVPPPESDPVCPDVTVFNVPVAGCCVPELNVCGVNTVQYGGGCVEAFGGLLGMLGQDTPCGDAAVPDEDDAGSL